MWFNSFRQKIGSWRNDTDQAAARRRAVGPILEVLEGRQLLSAAPAAGHTAAVTVVTSTVRAQSETFRVEAGQSATGDVGVLTGVKGVAGDFHNLHASIDWGDGSDPTEGSFTRDGRGRIHVRGTHTYDAAGRYDITVTVSETPNVPPGQPNPFFAIRIATINSRAVVSPADGGVSLIEVATQKFTATLGSFTFPNVDLRLTASIDWGDGTKSTGQVVKTGTTFDHFDVIGSHSYNRTGVYKVHVNVTASPFGGPQLPGTTPIASFVSTIDVKGRA